MTHGSDGCQDGKILVRVDPDLADLIPGFLYNRRKDVTAMQDALGQAAKAKNAGEVQKGLRALSSYSDRVEAVND